MAPLVYSVEGKDITEQLWNETIEEFSFAQVDSIIRDISI